jgi:hypothetical protein
MRGISCNPTLGLLQGIASLCRRAPHSIFIFISRRRQPWVPTLIARVPGACSGPQTAHVFARVTQHCAMHTDAD